MNRPRCLSLTPKAFKALGVPEIVLVPVVVLPWRDDRKDER